VGRLRDESGMGLVELLAATFVLTTALLALAAGYEAAAISIQKADKKTVAAKLAASQIELYQSLKVSAVGLDQTTLANIQAAGSSVTGAADYVSDEAGLTPTGTDHTIASCGSSAQCSPIQDVTGPENHPYRIETFVRDVLNSGAGSTWYERFVTVIVRDRGTTGNPIVFSETSGFDPGP